MKALWKGNISLALVSIPVKLYNATHKKDISFHMLHKKCSTPLSYERYCSTCKTDVLWEDVVHGYEYEKGKFVIVTDEEIDHIPIKTSKNIEIVRFVEPKEIDPLFYDKSYYIEPDEGGERAYALLRESMKASEKVALSKIVFKEKEHLAVLRVFHDVLMLHTLFYADEIVKPEVLNIPKKVSIDTKELALANELVKHYSGKFNIESYHDEFRDALMGLITAKIAGKEVKIPPKKEVERVVSLMDALKKSLEKKKKAV